MNIAKRYEPTLIEKCPACFGSGSAGGGQRGDFARCLRCEGTGRRAQIDMIDPTGQDVLVLYGVVKLQPINVGLSPNQRRYSA